MQAHESKRGGWLPRRPALWVIIVGLLLVLGATAPPLASRTYAWSAATLSSAVFLIRLWLVVLAVGAFAIPVELLLRRVRIMRGRAPVRWHWWTRAGLLLLCVVFAALSHVPLARWRVAGFVNDATSELGRSFRLSGSARITGRAARMVLIHALKQTEVPEERAALSELIDALPRAWVFAADAGQIDAIEVLAGAARKPSSWHARVTEFLLGHSEEAFSPEHCGQLLDRLCDDAGLERLSGGSRNEATRRLSVTLAHAVRQAVREAFVRGDEGAGAVPLAALTEQIIMARLGGSLDDPVWQSELAALSSECTGASMLLLQTQDATGVYGSSVQQAWWKVEAQCESALQAVHETHADFLAVAMGLAQSSATEAVLPPILDATMASAVERLAASTDPIDRALAAIAGVQPPLFGATWATADAAIAAALAEDTGPAARPGFDTFRLNIVRGCRLYFDADWAGAKPSFDAAFLAWQAEPAGLLLVGEVLRLPRRVDRLEAVLEARRLLESRAERNFAIDDADAATVLNNLAMNLTESSGFAEARVHLLDALKLDAETRGPDDPALAVRYFNLAIVSMNLGEFDRAQQEIERAAAIEAKSLPHGHWRRARTNLLRAAILDSNGNFEPGLGLAETAVAHYHQIFPPQHPAIGDADHVLARILYHSGAFTEAIPIAARSIENEQSQTLPHPMRLGQRREILAMSLWSAQGAAAALPFIEQAIADGAGSAASLPTDMATRHFNHASMLRDVGRLEDAVAAVDRCIAIEEDLTGAEAATMADSLDLRASLLRRLGRPEEALAAARRAVEVAAGALGENDLSLSQRLGLVTNILIDLERWEEANVSVERSIAIVESASTPDDATLATHYFNHAITLSWLDRQNEAAAEMHKSIAIDERHHGPDHPELIPGLVELAVIFENLGRIDDAKGAIERAITIAEATEALDNATLVEHYQTLAAYLDEMEDWNAAIAVLSKCVTFCAADPELAEREVEARNWIGWLLIDEGRSVEAVAHIEASLERAQSLLAPGHQLIAEMLDLLDEARANSAPQDPPDQTKTDP